MNDELKKIEIETARLRLERERLAYEEQLDKRNRSRRVSAATQQAFDTTKDVGSVALGASVSLFKIAFGFLLGAAGWALAAAFIFVVDPKITNFGFHYGYWAGSGGWVLILFGGITGALFASQKKKAISQSYLFGSHWPSDFWKKFNTYGCFVGGVITMIVGYRSGDVTVMIFGGVGFLFGFIMPHLKK